MDQPFHPLRRADQPAGAAADGLPGRAHGMAAAGRAGVREHERHGSGGAAVQNHGQDLRNHVAGPLKHHHIADTDVLAGDLILVVQGRPRNQHAAHVHRFQFGHGRQRAGAPHLDPDLLQDGRGLFGGKLPRHGPAWRAPDKTKAPLQAKVVQLVHHAIDVVGQAGAFRGNLRLERVGLVLAAEPAGQRVDREPPVPQPLQIIPMRVGHLFACLALCVGKQGKPAPRGDPGIELAQAAGGGVARVGENLPARFGLGLVQGEEIRLGHEHLAADFDQRGRPAFQGCGQGRHRAEVRGDVLTLGAVAARRAAHEMAVLVGQVDRQPINLGFAHEGQLPRQSQEAPGAVAELPELRRIEGIVQRQHGHPMAELGEPRFRCAADTAGRRVRAYQVRKPGLDRGIPPAQRVIGRIGDFRGVLLVVGAIVVGDLRCQACQFLGGFSFRQRFDGRQGGLRGVIHGAVAVCRE